MLGSEHPLHEDNVEPLAKFSTDFPFGSYRGEAQRLMKSDRGIVATNDSGHNRMESTGCANLEKFAQKGSGHPLSAEVGMDIDRVLDRGGIGRPVSVGRK